jgi:hypothetical protein
MCPYDTPAHRAIAIAGWVLTVVGLVGIILYPKALVVWAFLLFFGLAAVPRAVVEGWRDRPGAVTFGKAEADDDSGTRLGHGSRWERRRPCGTSGSSGAF